MRKKLFSILALLLIMAAATGPARAQTIYNDWVNYSDLQVGDVLYKGSYIIGIDSYFRLNIIGGRYKQNATQQLENSQFDNDQITAYNIDGSIEANGNVYTPCSATGADGDAWVVTQIGHDICIAGIKVYTSAVALSSLEEGDILMQGFSITGSGNVQLNEGRYMTGNDVGNVNTTSAVSNLSFGSDCSITTSAGTHYPYNGSAQGNAWYVKSVENGSVQLAGIAIPAANQQGGMTVLWNYAFNLNNNGTITQNDVTLTPGNGDARLLRNFYDYGDNTFSTTLGNFTKIEIICTYGSMSGWTSEVIGQYSEGMMGMGMGNNMRDLYKLTWTGESNSVTIHADVYGIQAIIFTIAGTERTLTGIPDGWSVTADGQSVTANADGSYTIASGAAVKLIPPTEVKPTVQNVTVSKTVQLTDIFDDGAVICLHTSMFEYLMYENNNGTFNCTFVGDDLISDQDNWHNVFVLTQNGNKLRLARSGWFVYEIDPATATYSLVSSEYGSLEIHSIDVNGVNFPMSVAQ